MYLKTIYVFVLQYKQCTFNRNGKKYCELFITGIRRTARGGVYGRIYRPHYLIIWSPFIWLTMTACNLIEWTDWSNTVPAVARIQSTRHLQQKMPPTRQEGTSFDPIKTKHEQRNCVLCTNVEKRKNYLYNNGDKWTNLYQVSNL